MATQTVDPQGNVIVNGFSTNLNPTQYVNSNIPVSSISATTPINLPDIKSTDLSSVVPTVQADIAGGLTSATSQVDQATKVADQARTQGISLSNLLAGTEANNVKDVSGTYQAQGVNTLYNQLQDLNAQATGLKNEASAIPIQNAINYQGSAGTQGQVTSVNRDQLSQNALKALSLGQQYAIASGNYEKAKSYADQLIETKYSAETARIQGLKDQQAALDKYTLTPAENARLEAVKKKTDLEAKALDQKIADQKEVSKLIIDASQVAPADVLQRAKDIQAKGGSATDVASALGQYGGNYLANQKLKVELQKAKVDLGKSIADANFASLAQQTPEISAWVSNIQSGKAKLSDVPAKLKSAVSVGLSAATSIDTSKVQGLRETAKNIDTLLNSNGLSLAVGTAPLGRQDVASGFRSDRQDFIAGVNQLINTKTLDTLISLKAQGGTLGALSDSEGVLLRSAASKIGSWEVKDETGKPALDKFGNSLGYDTSESSFKTELETIKRLTEKAIQNAGGSPIVSTGNTTADSYVRKSMQSLQSSQIMTPAQQGGYVDNQK